MSVVNCSPYITCDNQNGQKSDSILFRELISEGTNGCPELRVKVDGITIENATLDVGLSATNDSVLVYGSSDGGTTKQVVHTDAQGDLQVDILSSALPTGAATESTLSSMSAKLPAALGQTTMSASLSVAIASNQSAIPVDPNTVTSWLYDRSSAFEASSVTNAAPCKVLSVVGFNNKSTAQYFLLFNSTTVPADTTAPYYTPILVEPGKNFSIDFGDAGFDFSTGCSWSNSSTAATKTIGSADMWVVVKYR